MRSNKHLIVGLTVTSAIVTIALVMGSASQAAQFGNFAAGPRAPAISTMRSSPSFSGSGAGLRSEPRFQRFNNNIDKVVTGDGRIKGKGKGKGTTVSTTDEGRPGHHRPR